MKTTLSHEGCVYVTKSYIGYRISRCLSYEAVTYKCGTRMPFAFELYAKISCHDPRRVENQLREMFHKKRINREWFDLISDDLLGIENYVKEKKLDITYPIILIT